MVFKTTYTLLQDWMVYHTDRKEKLQNITEIDTRQTIKSSPKILFFENISQSSFKTHLIN